MKKLVSMILTLSLLLAIATLAGCAEKEAPAVPAAAPVSEATAPPAAPAAPAAAPEKMTEAMLKASKASEYVPEKIEAGMEVVIGWSLRSFNGVGGAVDPRLKEELPKLGLTYITALDDGDVAKQIANIENFVTAGCAAILIHCSDISVLEDAVTKAEKAGTCCILYGDIPKFHMSAYTSTDLAALGYGVGVLVRAWLDENNPGAGDGDVKVAVHGSYVATPSALMSDNIKLAIQDDARCVTVYTEDGVDGLDAGYLFAQSALTTDSDIRVFAGFSLQSAFGCNNYVMSLPGINTDEWCSVGATYDISQEEFLKASERGEGIFRGSVAGSTDPAWGHIECIKAVLFNHEERPVIRMQDIHAYSGGHLEIGALMEENYYGVYT